MTLCIYYMSIQIIAMSDFGETLITQDFNARIILLKMWLSLIIFLTTFKLIWVMVFSWRYGKPMIFKYDFN